MIAEGSTVSLSQGDTTWVGVVTIVRADDTAKVQWHTPMRAESMDVPLSHLTEGDATGDATHATGDTIYATCRSCGHVEPRPTHAAEDWHPCETCGQPSPSLHSSEDAAEAESERVTS